MGLVQNSKRILNNLVDKILVALSLDYIKHLAKQTLKKQDNSSLMEFSPNPLTAESPPTIIATSSQGTSEKTIMMETDKIVDHIRDWAKERVDSLDGPESVYNKLALIDEFHEWFDLSNTGEEIEVITLDEITQDQYDDYTEYMNDGIERG